MSNISRKSLTARNALDSRGDVLVLGRSYERPRVRCARELARCDARREELYAIALPFAGRHVIQSGQFGFFVQLNRE